MYIDTKPPEWCYNESLVKVEKEGDEKYCVRAPAYIWAKYELGIVSTTNY